MSDREIKKHSDSETKTKKITYDRRSVRDREIRQKKDCV